MNDLPQVTIYTDGACKGNPGRGSWAAVLIWNNGETVIKEISGVFEQTTNNRMELTAVVEAENPEEKCNVTIYSDSAYIVNAFRQKWVANWQRNGWKTADKSPVKNQELWEAILDQCSRHHVRFEKVKGHAGVHYNERVDQLANLALER